MAGGCIAPSPAAQALPRRSEREPEQAGAVGEEVIERQPGRVQLAPHGVARELRADLGADLLVVGEVSSRSTPSMRTICAPLARRRISIHELASSKKATCSKASVRKSASRPALRPQDAEAIIFQTSFPDRDYADP